MKRATKSDPLARILAAARKDPQFFHELVFAPKKAIAKASFLDRATRAHLLDVRAGTVIAGLLGRLAACGNDQTCSGSTCSGATCGGETCNGVTCGGSSCQDTCLNSCADTISPPRPGPMVAQLESIKWKTLRTRVSARAKTARKR
jgi:hypothetical protein